MYPTNNMVVSLKSRDIHHVAYQRKVIAGADLILDPSMYPAAPATIHPTTRPMMIEMFFMNGLPNSSVSKILAKERKPSPTSSGDPHLEHER
jgi:hypothetical protein